MNLLASAKVHNTANVAKEHYKTRSKPLLPSFLLPSIFSNSANEHYLYAILTFSFSRVLILILVDVLVQVFPGNAKDAASSAIATPKKTQEG